MPTVPEAQNRVGRAGVNHALVSRQPLDTSVDETSCLPRSSSHEILFLSEHAVVMQRASPLPGTLMHSGWRQPCLACEGPPRWEGLTVDEEAKFRCPKLSLAASAPIFPYYV